MITREIVARNLIFRFNYDSKFKRKKGEIKQEVRYFLIGALPALIELENGDKERVAINHAIQVKQGAFLRVLDGQKFLDLKKIQREFKKKFPKNSIDFDYSKDAEILLYEMTVAVDKIIKTKIFNNKKIKDIFIIKG